MAATAGRITAATAYIGTQADAVHECCCLSAGHPIAGNIAEVHLKQGDVLIVEAGPEFLANFKNNRAFSLISEVPKSSPMKRSKMWIALVLTVAMVSTQV